MVLFGFSMASARFALRPAGRRPRRGGCWLLTGGGGYEPLRVVRRTWTHLLAEAPGHPIDSEARIPAAWRE